MTAAYLVGWLLSIYWGYLIVMKAFTKEDGSLDSNATKDVTDLMAKNPEITRQVAGAVINA